MSSQVQPDSDHPSHAGSPEASILSLRFRLEHSRLQRGACPDFRELREDHLPQVQPRSGRDERERHVEVCLVCQQRLRNWRAGWQSRGDWALAAGAVGAYRARVHGGHVLRATGRILGRGVRQAARAGSTQSREPHRRNRSNSVAPARKRTRATPFAISIAGWFEPLRRRKPSSGSAAAHELPPLVVVEESPGLPDAQRLAEPVVSAGGALVTVESVEEVFSDDDFAAVRTLVLTRPRSLAEWPRVLAEVRQLAGHRTVLAVVPLPPSGAGRELEHDPAVVPAPITLSDWQRALERAGWVTAS